MGKFGWSYPAGCEGTPFDEPCGCDVCGQECDSCTCPVCPACGVQGRKECIEEHWARLLDLLGMLTEGHPGIHPANGLCRWCKADIGAADLTHRADCPYVEARTFVGLNDPKF